VAQGGCPVPRRVAVVGAGAAGTLTALHLAAAARGRRGERLEVLLVDPAEHVGRGVAYSTRDGRHLLNVPARGMSAFPDEPNHFVDWLCRHVDSRTAPGDFARRSDFAAYLDDTLRAVVADTDGVAVVHRRTRATGLTVREGQVDLTLGDGTQPRVDAAVVAPGVFAPGTAWAPAALVGHDRFVADPWAPGALAAVPDDGDVLLVGTGLTGVDVALTLDRPGRTLHVVSRRGRLPAVHATGRCGAAGSPLPELVSVARGSRPADLEHLRRLVARTVRDGVRERRDWRAAFDTLRPLTGALWSSLSADDQARFLREDAAWWDLHRHRMAPVSAAALHGMRHGRRLTVGADEVVAVAPGRDRRGDGLEVRLRSGRVVRVAAVVNCTGPLGDVRRAGDPFLDHLLAAGVATPGPLGLGLATDDGRLVDARGTSAAPVWTLGAMRRGELWESTAVPEIRGQAAGVAAAVHDELAAASRRRRRPAPAAPPDATPRLRRRSAVSFPRAPSGEVPIG
jgi:uncharacterized NAD(P)/FAD-binding protein YdhS